MTFPERLKQLRAQRGLTQDILSKQSGLTKSSIAMYETGKRKPKIEVLERLADFFNVDLDYLVGKSDRTTVIVPPAPPKSEEQSTILEMFSANLNRIMAEKRMSNTELANGVGVTPTTIGNWRNGKKFPRMDKVDKICNFLQISRGDLIKVEDVRERPSYYDDPEVAAIANELKNNPDMRVLFDASRHLSKQDIQTVATLVKSLSQKGGD